MFVKNSAVRTPLDQSACVAGTNCCIHLNNRTHCSHIHMIRWYSETDSEINIFRLLDDEIQPVFLIFFTVNPIPEGKKLLFFSTLVL